WGTRLGRVAVMKTMQSLERMTDRDMRIWVGVEKDVYDEEAGAQARQENMADPNWWPEWAVKEGERLGRVLQAIRAKLLGEQATRDWIARAKPMRETAQRVN